MLENLMEYRFLLEMLQPETLAILSQSLLDIISFRALNEFSEYVLHPSSLQKRMQQKSKENSLYNNGISMQYQQVTEALKDGYNHS